MTNDEILDRADLIFASGIENLKLYYMIGLPTETDDDLVAIRDLTLQMRDRMLKHARAARPDRPHRRQREPADSEAGHRVSVAADGRPGGRSTGRSSGCAALTAGHRQRLLQHQVGAALVLPGAAVARRPPRRAGDRGRRAQRPELARRGRRDAASTPTSTSSATAAATPCCRGTSSTAA